MVSPTAQQSAVQVPPATTNVIEAVRERQAKAHHEPEDVLTWIAEHRDYYRDRAEDAPLYALGLVVAHHGTSPVLWSLALGNRSPRLAWTWQRAQREYQAAKDEQRVVPVHSSSVVGGAEHRGSGASEASLDVRDVA